MITQRILVFNADQKTTTWSYIKQKITNFDVDIFCVSELSNKGCKELKNSLNNSYHCIHERLDYATDRILIGFNKNKYNLKRDEHEISNYGKYMSIHLTHLKSNYEFKVVAVHLPRKNVKQFLAINLLKSFLVQNKDIPIILMGDFNMSYHKIHKTFLIKPTVNQSTTCNKSRCGIDNICFIMFDVLKQFVYLENEGILSHIPILSDHVIACAGG